MSGTKTLDKAITIFKLAIDSGHPVDSRMIADRMSLPLATVYRHIAAFEKQGLIRRESQGALGPGAELVALVDREHFHDLLSEAARPILREVSRKLDMISHIGVYEDDMVTYLVKSEPEGQKIFTREKEQLEAYCTGIGKVLLSELPADDLDAYLSTGPFPALTENTTTEPDDLRRLLVSVKKDGYAVDDSEMERDLFCIAVPLRNPDGTIIAALSATCRDAEAFPMKKESMRRRLIEASVKLGESLYGRRAVNGNTPNI